MAGTTYYEILGVSPRESTRGIQEAFRRLAKQHHPDYAGTEGTAFFRSIVEAYEVLSDPHKRAAYNRTLPRSIVEDQGGHEAEGTRVPIHYEYEPRPYRADVETLCGPSFRSRRRRESASPFGTWTLEAILSPDEARWGTVATVHLPVTSLCPDCNGTGWDWMVPCGRCAQSGTVIGEPPVQLAIPPGVRNHEVVEVPLDPIGLASRRLRLLITITS